MSLIELSIFVLEMICLAVGIAYTVESFTHGMLFIIIVFSIMIWANTKHIQMNLENKK